MKKEDLDALPESHEITITFFDVRGGDAIWIRYLGNDSKWHNILVDGGYGNSYKTAFGPLISKISKGEVVDLWIITHTDADHIGAILGFIKDKKISKKKEVVTQIWFNYSPSTVEMTTGKLSVKQGMNLRTYLEVNGYVVMQPIDNNLPAQDLHGLKIKVLSPSLENLAKSKNHWKDTEKQVKMKLGRTQDQADHSSTIEELKHNTFSEDTDPWNGASIAFLVEFKDVRCLFLSDSHPSVVVSSLNILGYTSPSPLNLGLVQLSHHGSKANNSPDLLNVIKTSTFVVTGNGITNRHPDKETLVRILLRNHQENESKFVFPSQTNALRQIFSVDQNPFSRWGFSCVFPPENTGSIKIPFLPII